MNETSKKGTLADFLELRNWKVASPPISAGPKRVPFSYWRRLSELSHPCKGQKIDDAEISGDLAVPLRKRGPPTRTIG